MILNPGLLSTTRRGDRFAVNILGIFCGIFVIRKLKNARLKSVAHIVLGIMQLYFFCGEQSFFTLIMISSTLIWWKLSRMFPTARVLFIVVMGWRVIMDKYSEHFQFVFSAHSISNFMNLSIRCISFGFELMEFRKMKSSKLKPEGTRPLPMKQEPDVLTTISYFLCGIAGSNIGPFFTYQTFSDSLHISCKNKDYKNVIFWKSIESLVLYMLVLVLEFIAPVTIYTDGTFELSSGAICLMYMTCHIIVTTSRLYMIWRLAEAACVGSGIGEYPTEALATPGKGPTRSVSQGENTEYNYETISNGRGHLWFFEHSVREMSRNWNATTQYWLVRYCYTTELIPKRFKLPRFLATMLINALWHGTQAVYFVGFTAAMLFIYADQMIIDALNKMVQHKNGESAVKYIASIFLWLSVTYTGCVLTCGQYDIAVLIFNKTYQISSMIVITCLSLVVSVEISSQKKWIS